MLVSQFFPAWFLGLYPSKRVILTSYEADFAASWGRKVRDIIEEHGQEMFGIRIRDDSSAAYRWEIERYGGGMFTAGAGGPITGKGGDLIIVDDPFKNAEEANSKRIRDKVWDWFQSTLYTRLEPDGSLIIIQTRWHHDDLVGRILSSNEGEQWTAINFPAIAEEDDVLGRKAGEPLWPERFDIETLERIKKTIGSYWWNALYQQRPSPEEGAIFKRAWWQFYKVMPDRFDEVIQSWDMSFKETASGSFVVGQVWGRIGANRYLLDQVRDRMDFPTTLQAVRALTAKWPQAHKKLVEEKANGPAVIATLKKEISGLVAVNPEGSKEARAHAVAPQVEAGNVFLPDPSIVPWVHDFIEECCAFPTGAHDDQVDAMTQALIELNKYTPLDEDIKQILRRASFYG
jgi:predicted phage terminase large subunit-like protein